MGICSVIVSNVVIVGMELRLCDICSSESRFESFSSMKRYCMNKIQKLTHSLFGITSSKEVFKNHGEEHNGWISYVLSQTKEAVELSEHNILCEFRNLEQRLEQKGLL